MWVYIQSEPGVYTVGFSTPGGVWNTDSDHTEREAAAKRVNYLNGGIDGEVIRNLESLLNSLLESKMTLDDPEDGYEQSELDFE